MIGIRVDANETIASGHILRCITIAKEIEKHGESVLFFLADEYGSSYLEEAGLCYKVLQTPWDRPLEEIEVFAKAIKNHQIKTVLFDSYQFTTEYFCGLHNELARKEISVRFCYIDDLFEEIYPVDLLVNYNAYHTKFPYAQKYGTDVKLLLGPGYVPLREEFSIDWDGIEKFSACDQKKHVLLSCGGGDALQVMKDVLTAFEKSLCAGVVWHVVVGRFTVNKEALFALGKSNSNIEIHYDVHNMAELMKRCDMAVSAAGTMLYELCATQCPTVFFITADNQRYDSSFFAEDERMLDAGDVRSDRAGCIRRILDGVQLLLTNPALCDTMKGKLIEITDGKGAQKIAREITNL